MFIAKKFDICESLLKNFDIFNTIVFMAAGIFFRHQAELVLRHQMQVSNYFVKFYSVSSYRKNIFFIDAIINLVFQFLSAFLEKQE